MSTITTWSKQCSLIVRNDVKALRIALERGDYEHYRPSPSSQFSLLHVRHHDLHYWRIPFDHPNVIVKYICENWHVNNRLRPAMDEQLLLRSCFLLVSPLMWRTCGVIRLCIMQVCVGIRMQLCHWSKTEPRFPCRMTWGTPRWTMLHPKNLR